MSTQKAMQLKKDTLTLKYGEAYSINPKTYVEADKKVLDQAKVKVKNPKWAKDVNNTDKYQKERILKPGKYDLQIIYKKEVEHVELEVVDKEAPRVYMLKHLEISEDTPNLDKEVLKLIKKECVINENNGKKFSTDDIKIKVDKVDKEKDNIKLIDVRGDYKEFYFSFTAKDQSGNTSEGVSAVDLKVKEKLKSVTFINTQYLETLGVEEKVTYYFDKDMRPIKGEVEIIANKKKSIYKMDKSDFQRIATSQTKRTYMFKGNSFYKIHKTNVTKNNDKLKYKAYFKVKDKEKLKKINNEELFDYYRSEHYVSRVKK